MQCPQCGSMMKPVGDMMKCESCGHTVKKEDMASGIEVGR